MRKKLITLFACVALAAVADWANTRYAVVNKASVDAAIDAGHITELQFKQMTKGYVEGKDCVRWRYSNDEKWFLWESDQAWQLHKLTEWGKQFGIEYTLYDAASLTAVMAGTNWVAQTN